MPQIISPRLERITMIRNAVLSIAMLLGSAAAATAQDKVDFATQIQPIFAAKCAGCHGEEKASGKLKLHTADAIGAFEKKDKLLVAGKPSRITAVGANWRRSTIAFTK